ncbi:hypothetical protein GMOD_00010118 [Pyrenophora seminiperda CCB06]|uniref:Uncharacterized protein n=1 Tax=Pyrenophora seminiperda CCB06 TaxID=1302712 RepID=A0A3M7LZV1_9PLEO|nr:hypothetical protein GMOD_00010118 [Pyrenophora seminiperda CCB06]
MRLQAWFAYCRRRELCRLVSRTSPLAKRKLLTRHCGTVLVVTTLRGADGSCKVLTVIMESCRGQPRLQCGRVAAALLPQFSRFCTENNAIALMLPTGHRTSQSPKRQSASIRVGTLNALSLALASLEKVSSLIRNQCLL